MDGPVYIVAMIKRRLREAYEESAGTDLVTVVNDVMIEFSSISSKAFFKKHGYVCDGVCDPGIGMHSDMSAFNFGAIVSSLAHVF